MKSHFWLLHQNVISKVKWTCQSNSAQWGQLVLPCTESPSPTCQPTATFPSCSTPPNKHSPRHGRVMTGSPVIQKQSFGALSAQPRRFHPVSLAVAGWTTTLSGQSAAVVERGSNGPSHGTLPLSFTHSVSVRLSHGCPTCRLSESQPNSKATKHQLLPGRKSGF